VLGVLMERARAIEDLLVLLIVVALGTRFIDSNDDVVWPAAVILTSLGSFSLITTTVIMVTAVVVVAVVVVVVVGTVVVAACWAMSARILIEAHLGFLGVGVLVGSFGHLTDPSGRLAVELGAKLVVMESSDEGGDNLGFRDVWNRIPHLRKASDVAAEELRWLLVDAVEIMLGSRSCTRSHIIVGEDFFQLFLGSDGVRGKASKPVHDDWRKHDGKIVHHDTGVSSGGTNSSGISL